MLVAIISPKREDFTNIFDDTQDLVRMKFNPSKEGLLSYNLNDMNSFTIEVSDKFGLVKKVTY